MNTLYALIPLFCFLCACQMSQPAASPQSLEGSQLGDDGENNEEGNDSNLNNYAVSYYRYADLALQSDNGDVIKMKLKFAQIQGRTDCLIERLKVCVPTWSKGEQRKEEIEDLDLEHYQWQRNGSQAVLRFIDATDLNAPVARLSLTCEKVTSKKTHLLTSVKYAPNTEDRDDLDDNGGDEAVYKASVNGFDFTSRWPDGYCGEVHSGVKEHDPVEEE